MWCIFFFLREARDRDVGIVTTHLPLPCEGYPCRGRSSGLSITLPEWPPKPMILGAARHAGSRRTTDEQPAVVNSLSGFSINGFVCGWGLCNPPGIGACVLNPTTSAVYVLLPGTARSHGAS